MTARYRLTSTETVLRDGSWLFTARDSRRTNIEVVLVPCAEEGTETSIQAWSNRCTHENQRLYREDVGAVVRDGGIVCPKHGSVFDSCAGDCDNGPAAGSRLRQIDVTTEGRQVYLVDEDVAYLHDGPRTDADDDDDDGPSSTSHLRF